MKFNQKRIINNLNELQDYLINESEVNTDDYKEIVNYIEEIKRITTFGF